MIKTLLRRFMYSFVIVASLMLWTTQHAHAQDAEPVRFVIEVTDGGFSYDEQFGSNINLEVDQGALVEITFVWAQQAYLNDEHIFALEGYDIESGKIDYYNRETTMTFVATEPGDFILKCIIECEIHDYLQGGLMQISRAGSGANAVDLVPTTLNMSTSSRVTTGQHLTLTISVRSADGEPVAKAPVHLFLDGEFAGNADQITIGNVRTDDNGVAFAEYQPTLDMEKHNITARFDGMGLFDQSEANVEIEQIGSPPPAYTLPPLGLSGPRHWAPLALIMVIVGIWLTFSYVLYQVFIIAREGKGAKAEKQF
jgi:hypothetical protein